MAGQGRKVFSDGDVLSAADVNGYLMDQSVMRFADSSARTAAIGTPTEGMVTYLDDVNQIEVYDGTAWVDQQAPILSQGTAGQYLQSNGTAGSTWVDLQTASDVITTRGDLLVGNSSGDPARLGRGSADQVLTSNGTDLVWADAGGGGSAWEEVSSGSIPNASSVTFSGLTGFDKYMIVVDNLRTNSSGDRISFRLNNNNTSNIYDLTALVLYDNDVGKGVEMTGSSATNNEIRIGETSSASFSDMFTTFYFEGARSSKYKMFQAKGASTSGGSYPYQSRVTDGIFRSTTAVTSANLVNSSGGTFSNGTYVIYGSN